MASSKLSCENNHVEEEGCYNLYDEKESPNGKGAKARKLLRKISFGHIQRKTTSERQLLQEEQSRLQAFSQSRSHSLSQSQDKQLTSEIGSQSTMGRDIEDGNSYNSNLDLVQAKHSRSGRRPRSSRRSSRSSRRSRSRSTSELRRQQLLEPFQITKTEEFRDIEELVEEEAYIVKQRKGHMSIFFSLVQTFVLVVMMMQCSIAPFNINPMIGPPPDALDYWGGKNAIKIIDDGEYFRLITPIFLHAGIIHLLGNISVQLDIGAFFEREWGTPIWMVIYITSAIGSSLFSVCFKPDNVSVGSSGAVMGLFGGKLGEIFCRACESRKTVQGRIGHEVRMEQLSGSLCSVTIVMAFSFVPFVDWAAHLGGLLAGFAVAFLCFSPMIKTKAFAIFWFCAGLAMNFFMYITLIGYMLNEVEPMNDLKDVCGYYKQYFDGYECQCQIDNK